MSILKVYEVVFEGIAIVQIQSASAEDARVFARDVLGTGDFEVVDSTVYLKEKDETE